MSASNSDQHFINPRTSSEFVVNLAKHVRVRDSGVDKLAQMLNNEIKCKNYSISVWKEHTLHPKVADERAIDWIFVVDSLNFSFWPKSDENYSINNCTGYWALCAAINRALDNGIPITDPQFYADISEQQFRQIFSTDNGNEIPLLQQRLQVLRDSGRVLVQNFGSSFVNCVKQSESNASNLLKLIVKNFWSFRDESVYREHRVSFYKRAQILIADIWACFEAQGLGYFQDIDELTMFADYRVPQVLAYFDAIEYSQQLKDLLKDDNHLMESGSEYEVEIRAASIVAVERIRDRLKSLSNTSINSIIIDFYLWDYRRENSQQIEDKTPFHRVRNIYY